MTHGHLTPILAILLAASPAMAQGVPPPPPRMTSDSAEYCNHLGLEFTRALRSHPQASPDARLLADEGSGQCGRGHYRAGVMRLRRALKMLRSGP